MTFGLLKHVPENASSSGDKIKKPEWLERVGERSDRGIEYQKKSIEGEEEKREPREETKRKTAREIEAEDQARTSEDARNAFKKIVKEYKQSIENEN